MMNEATREFIRQHGQDDIRELALRGTKDPEVDLAFALQQIDGHRRALEKLPSWAAVEGIVWPPHLSMEQCSSERTARYKAQVAGKGQLFVDLTAGFGVDAAFIAQGFQQAVCVELQPELCAISSANFQLLGLPQIEVVNGNGVEYLHAMPPVDLIFIDPARRDEHGGRTYGIADCTPNVLEIIDELLEKAQRVMIKLSPMLDWRKAVEDIGKEHVSAVHIVSVANECKELLVEVMFSRKENSALPLATEGTQESGKRNLTVRPPRLGGNKRIGVFASRSPFRPNSLGLSCVRIDRVEEDRLLGPVIYVRGADLMDGTPIYDIKPYVTYADAHPGARSGFVDQTAWESLHVEIPDKLAVRIPKAHREALKATLAQDPRPAFHDDPERVYGMPFLDMDIRFRVSNGVLTVVECASAPKVGARLTDDDTIEEQQ